jgi:prepilin signal peptidase PulO-like enzyme (type II secretory pathway)
MTRFQVLDTLLQFLVFYIGAGIGSFLNVVIYRLPLGISVDKPRRSFCPSCKYQIPMWQNIPLLSWLLLRGKCANCGGKISMRYFWVELLTGVLFYMVFLKISGEYPNPWLFIKIWGPHVLCVWVFVSLLIAGTFIDIDHFILPHSITIGGAVVGVLAAWWVPALVEQDTHTHGVLISLASAALGLGGLWLVVELGKLAFGRKKFVFEKEEEWQVTQPDENEPPVVVFGEHKYDWADLFMRTSDRMVVSCNSLQVNERSFGPVPCPRASAAWWPCRQENRSRRCRTRRGCAFFAAAVSSAPPMMAPAWPMRRPGGAVAPAMKAAMGFLQLSLAQRPASTSALPPISPIMMMASVSGSSLNILSTSRWLVPFTGSPPMPTQVLWP